MFVSKLRQRLSRQEGFTPIELLVVLIIIGVLLAIAVPSYLGFKDRAEKRAAQSDVRAAIPSAEAYYSDDVTEGGGGGSYTGISVGALRAIDAGINLDNATAETVTATGDAYCLSKHVGNYWGFVHGPGLGTDGINGVEVTAKGVLADPCV